MAYFLLVLALVNDVLFAVLGIQSLSLAQRVPTPRARTQAYLVALVCGAFVVASTQRVGLQLVEIGILDPSRRELLTGSLQLVTGVGALVLIVPALWMLRRLTAMFARSDRFVTVLMGQVALDASVSDAGLTARELEVLQHVAEGVLTDSDLAEALYVSPSTAATHVRNIMKKTGVRRRHELMLLAPDGIVDTG